MDSLPTYFMKFDIGEKYDKIAQWWHSYHEESTYGLGQVERAISYCKVHGSALDVGCGSGGRIIRKLEQSGFRVTGIDASTKMIEIAKSIHNCADFYVADICSWDTDEEFDFIIAWDSIFHLPLSMHAQVIQKLCSMLQKGGVLMYTFGDDYGEHVSDWHHEKFYYSSLGINENLKIIMENNCECRHLELDQYPQKHVYMIVEKR